MWVRSQLPSTSSEEIDRPDLLGAHPYTTPHLPDDTPSFSYPVESKHQNSTQQSSSLLLPAPPFSRSVARTLAPCSCANGTRCFELQLPRAKLPALSLPRLLPPHRWELRPSRWEGVGLHSYSVLSVWGFETWAHAGGSASRICSSLELLLAREVNRSHYLADSGFYQRRKPIPDLRQARESQASLRENRRGSSL